MFHVEHPQGSQFKFRRSLHVLFGPERDEFSTGTPIVNPAENPWGATDTSYERQMTYTGHSGATKIGFPQVVRVLHNRKVLPRRRFSL
jgi:hypothetical protein